MNRMLLIGGNAVKGEESGVQREIKRGHILVDRELAMSQAISFPKGYLPQCGPIR